MQCYVISVNADSSSAVSVLVFFPVISALLWISLMMWLTWHSIIMGCKLFFRCRQICSSLFFSLSFYNYMHVCDGVPFYSHYLTVYPKYYIINYFLVIISVPNLCISNNILSRMVFNLITCLWYIYFIMYFLSAGVLVL